MHTLNMPEVFANAFANTFDDQGNLTDSKIQANIITQLEALQIWTSQLQK